MNTSIELLRLLVFNYEPDVLLIQETFLTKGKKTPEINEYTPYRKDRTLPRQVTNINSVRLRSHKVNATH